MQRRIPRPGRILCDTYDARNVGRAWPAPARRGAAVVELALLLPFLSILLLGMCELGQALWVNACLSDAARIGCETGSRPGCSNADVAIDVNAALTANSLPATAATITMLVNNKSGNIAAARRNDKITVTISIPTNQVSWTKSFFFMGTNSVQSQSGSMLKQG
jgi:Flp pilus assembly protein TadG